MTCAIQSRWYRSPEIILTDKTYGKAVDIWGIGTTLLELVLKASGAQDIYFFQGSSCFPISPKDPEASDADYVGDQLVKIIHRLKRSINPLVDFSFLTGDDEMAYQKEIFQNVH